MKTSTFPPSSAGFDWLMGILALLLIGGLYQDGWAHSHGQVDQSFFTPWHAILYGSMAVNGIVLGVKAVFNVSRGYPVRYVLPFGYWLSLVGVILFALGGLFDLIWHSIFGIEADLEALVSPTHLFLAFSAALILVGPLRATAKRVAAQSSPGWNTVGPAVLSVTATLLLLGFFTQFANPIGDDATATVIGKNDTPAPADALYAVQADGARQTRILSDPVNDLFGGAISPDGKHLLYRAERNGETRSWLVVAAADGSHAKTIFDDGRHNSFPAWSPDGKWIAFGSSPAGTSGSFAIAVVRPDGSEHRVVTSSMRTVLAPSWSPDGTKIAYASRHGLIGQIAVVAVQGGTPQWIAGTENGSLPAWSPDGVTIAFVRSEDNTLASVPATGGTAKTIVHDGSWPAWSRDGKQIAYVANAGGFAQVFVANADGSVPVDVSGMPGLDVSHPVWSPDGRILFAAIGRPAPLRTTMGQRIAIDTDLIDAVLIAGAALMLVRRWRLPFGTLTVLLGLFAIALATQSDLYYAVVPAVATGLLADLAMLLLGDRLRQGNGFYAFGFALPFLFFALYVIAVGMHAHGLGWPANMTTGSPVLGGIAGLLIAFCFAPPLAERSPAPVPAP